MTEIESGSPLLATHLRKLAREIEQLCRDSPVHSNTWPFVVVCSERIQAEARVIEANHELEKMRAQVAKLPKLRAKARKKR